MKIPLVYESIYGNTAAIAEAVADGLRALGDVDVRAVGEEAVEADMIVVGVPTHAHGLPSSMTRKDIEAAVEEAEAKGSPLDYQPTAGIRKFLNRLPEVDGTAAACFDTRLTSPGSSPARQPSHGAQAGPARLQDRRRTRELLRPGLRRAPSKRASWTAPVGGERPLGPQLT